MNTITINGKAWIPETRYTQTGTCITEVSVSVYDGKDQEGKAKYYNLKCKCFKDLAENVGNQVAKGDSVIVSGRLTEEKWEKDGATHKRTVLLIDSIGKEISRFGGQGANTTPAKGNGYDVSSFGTEVFPEEEIPF
jgi:single-strand DNA-binding protein